MRRSRVRLSVAPFSRGSPAFCQPFCSSPWFRLSVAPFSRISPAFCQPFCSSPRFLCSYVLTPGWTASSLAPLSIPSRVDLSQLCTPHAQHALVRLSQTSVRDSDRAVRPCPCKMLSLSPDAYPEVRVATSFFGEKVSEQTGKPQRCITQTVVCVTLIDSLRSKPYGSVCRKNATGSCAAPGVWSACGL